MDYSIGQISVRIVVYRGCPRYTEHYRSGTKPTDRIEWRRSCAVCNCWGKV